MHVIVRAALEQLTTSTLSAREVSSVAAPKSTTHAIPVSRLLTVTVEARHFEAGLRRLCACTLQLMCIATTFTVLAGMLLPAILAGFVLLLDRCSAWVSATRPSMLPHALAVLAAVWSSASIPSCQHLGIVDTLSSKTLWLVISLVLTPLALLVSVKEAQEHLSHGESWRQGRLRRSTPRLSLQTQRTLRPMINQILACLSFPLPSPLDSIAATVTLYWMISLASDILPTPVRAQDPAPSLPTTSAFKRLYVPGLDSRRTWSLRKQPVLVVYSR